MSKSIFSKITTWTIRILLLFIALGALSLLMLTTMGGTSESHRKGLEHAFSDSLDADVRLGKLSEFNIIPQLTLKTETIRGVMHNSKNEFLIDQLVISFGFSDLLLGRRKIEDFQLDNFRLSTDSEYDLRIDHAGIEKTAMPVFVIKGEFDKKDFNFSIPLQQDQGARPVYYFAEENSISGKYGSLLISGQLTPTSSERNKFIKDLKILHGKDLIANGRSEKPAKGSYKIVFECLPGQKMATSVRSDLKSLAKMEYVELSESCLK